MSILGITAASAAAFVNQQIGQTQTASAQPNFAQQLSAASSSQSGEVHRHHHHHGGSSDASAGALADATQTGTSEISALGTLV